MTGRGFRTVLLATLAVCLLGGCERGGGGWEAARQDAPAAVWRFTGDAVAEMDAGAEPFVQVTSAVRAGNVVAVGDAGAKRVGLFSADGKLLRNAGRAGQGPGEFQYVGWVGAAGDSILAWDPLLSRLSVFSADGRLLREASASIPGFFPSIHGRFADGSLLVSVPPATGRAPVPQGQSWRDTAVYLRMAATGRVLDTVGRFPGFEQYQPPSADPRNFRTMSVPFGKWTSAAVAGNRFFVSTGDEYRVDGFASSGAPGLVVRRAVEPLPVTRGEREAYMRLVAEGAGARAAETVRELSAAPIPRTMPPITGVLTDGEGRLWVGEAQTTANLARGSRWSVFDASGKWIARAEGPPRFSVYQIGPDWVLGNYTDDDGVSHVRIQPLKRG